MDYFRFHKEQKNFWICTAPHLCCRKPCTECIYQHEFDKFIYSLQERLQQRTVNKTTINQIHLNFKSLYSQVEQFIKDIMEFLKKIQQDYEKIDYEEQIQFQVLEQLQNPSEFSSYQLNKLIAIFQGQTFEEQGLSKTNELIIIQSSMNWLKEKIKQYKNELKDKISQYFSKQCGGEVVVKNQVENNLVLIELENSQKNNIFSQTYVGGWYSNNGKKQGLWREKIINFPKEFQVYEVGEYMNDRKFGIWKYFIQNKQIGGGPYNKGQKEGRWIEIVDQFLNQNKFKSIGDCKNGKQVDDQKVYERRLNQEEQIQKTDSNQDIGIESEPLKKICVLMFIGDYLKDQKVGKWDFYWRFNDQIILVGGGCFGEKGKMGDWIELSEMLSQKCYLLLRGKYQNNKRVGKWKQEWRDYQNNNFIKIKGGFFDQGNGIKKIGIWTEICSNFNFDNQVTLTGIYCNGKKQGRWNIQLQDNQMKHLIKIHGGRYDKDGLKNGKWIEIRDQLSFNQINFNGEYVQGNREGMWVFEFQKKYMMVGCYVFGKKEKDQQKRDNYNYMSKDEIIDVRFQEFPYFSFCRRSETFDIKFGQSIKQSIHFPFPNYKEEDKQIGSDDQVGIQQKIGKWGELDENFSYQKQVTHHGEYNINFKKVGRWYIMYRKSGDQEYKQIGGGSYDEEGNQKKIGKWVVLDEKFNYNYQVTYNGEYNMYNMKVGRWDIMYCKYDEKEYKQINISNLQLYIVVVDHMIKKEIRKRLESGLKWMKNLIIIYLDPNKSLIMVNII